MFIGTFGKQIFAPDRSPAQQRACGEFMSQLNVRESIADSAVYGRGRRMRTALKELADAIRPARSEPDLCLSTPDEDD
jgi:hypothetical protein